MRTLGKHTLLSALALVTAAFAGTATADPPATVILYNADAPGVGLNDPTPAAPVGGNPMTTLGGQRAYALQHAARLWANNLRSHVPLEIVVAFQERPCDAGGAVLASAGPWAINSDFKHARYKGTWHHSALANAIAKSDLEPEYPDVFAAFNVNLGKPGCLTGVPFYLGVDNNNAPNEIDLVVVALHEYAHGLGFSQFSSLSTGEYFFGQPDVYMRHLLDAKSGLTWDMMTPEQRVASAKNGRNVVWTGANVTAAVPEVLSLGVPILNVSSPASVAGGYPVGTASFGPALSSPGVSGQVALGIDTVGNALDACTPIVSDVAGKLGLVIRGTCAFTVKVKNLQNAGAIGAIIIDNAAGSPPPGLGGADPTITIPAVRVTFNDGLALFNAVNAGDAVNATLGVDLTRYAGANGDGLAQLNATDPVQPGSSISHWDPIAAPNLLMEPAINFDVESQVDLTLPLFEDLGWQIERRQGHGFGYGRP